MPFETKIIIYKSLLRPIWAYVIKIWEGPFHTRTIHVLQYIYLRVIISTPWYVSNNYLHNDLNIETISQLAKKTLFKPPSKTPFPLKPYNFPSFCCQSSWQPNPSIKPNIVSWLTFKKKIVKKIKLLKIWYLRKPVNFFLYF